ncbi:MAG: DUF1080 domain-containing protein [Planctomycetaceae bacterium]
MHRSGCTVYRQVTAGSWNPQGDRAAGRASLATRPRNWAICLLPAIAATASAAAPPAGNPPIFNGRDLAGWKVVGAPYWRVVDGAIVGESDAHKKGSMLYTEAAYGDCVVEADVRFAGEIDSGIMVRKPELQVQIGVSRSLKRDMTCSFYVGQGGYPEEARAPRAAELLEPGEWNRIRIEARGDTFTVWLNGEQVSRYTTTAHRDPAPIGLQVHAGLAMKVEFRDVRAAPLP